MDTDDLLKRVRAIPGVMAASIMNCRQRDRLYVKVASGDANPVNRRVHPLLEQYPDLGLLYEYEHAEPCGAYDAMDRAISSLTYRSPTGPKARLTGQIDSSASQLPVPSLLSTVTVLPPRHVVGTSRTAPVTPTDIVVNDNTPFRVAP